MKLKNSLGVLVAFYALTVIFWLALLIFIQYSIFNDGILDWLRLFTQIPLMIIPLVGGIFGLKNYTNWGGIKNTLGKSSLFLSLGLISWASGMIAWNYYIFFTKIEIPYPSLADFGFVFGLLFLIIGVSALYKMIGVKFALKNKGGKFVLFIFPIIVILVSVYLLIYVARGGVLFDSSENYLKLFFDILYPLGDVIILTIIGLLYFLSKKFLSGVYKTPILVLFSGFLLFYMSDFIFVFTTTQGIYYNGHFVDFLYTTSMFILSLGVISLDAKRMLIDNVVNNIKHDEPTQIVRVTNADNSERDLILKEIILTIIKRQKKIAGQVAWEEAKNVSGIKMIDEQRELIEIEGDLKKVVNELMERYKNIFGHLSVQISKEAVYSLTIKLPPEEVPESLR